MRMGIVYQWIGNGNLPPKPMRILNTVEVTIQMKSLGMEEKMATADI